MRVSKVPPGGGLRQPPPPPAAGGRKVRLSVPCRLGGFPALWLPGVTPQIGHPTGSEEPRYSPRGEPSRSAVPLVSNALHGGAVCRAAVPDVIALGQGGLRQGFLFRRQVSLAPFSLGEASHGPRNDNIDAWGHPLPGPGAGSKGRSVTLLCSAGGGFQGAERNFPLVLHLAHGRSLLIKRWQIFGAIQPEPQTPGDGMIFSVGHVCECAYACSQSVHLSYHLF